MEEESYYLTEGQIKKLNRMLGIDLPLGKGAVLTLNVHAKTCACMNAVDSADYGECDCGKRKASVVCDGRYVEITMGEAFAL